MSIEKVLHERSGSVCELCGSTEQLQVYSVPPIAADADKSILVCKTCFEQINDPAKIDVNHWRCLNNSMWSTVPAVQVMAWRLLNSLRHEGWPQDLLDMLYLDDETLAWAKSTEETDDLAATEKVIHKDSNGTVLQTGDTVVLIKDLDVKGGGFTAKRGTAVRGITLVEDNASQIEGKVNGQQIVILTQFVKKS
ncbi:alkylphosphonate utilization protein [Chryseolinea sp. H1M3-3]|uniref:PhnA domain-containing protein n=1 Tax=Chryseolinea sp. H1M3-3 TaxID=3034144 RepID=UPI0023EB9D74|nr:alkylphosphonate utilization protein [Chryseolinea sp. H1M3-3]